MIKENLNSLIAEAMKNHDEASLRTYRWIKTEFTNAEKSGKEYNELKVISKMVKQREDSIQQYIDAGRPELAQKEQEELAILSTYLPKEATEEDVKNIISAYLSEKGNNHILSMKDMKPVMTKVQESFPTADGKLISVVLNKVIKERG